MLKNLLIFLTIFLAVYGLANFYVGLRIRQACTYFFPARRWLFLYWLPFLLLAAAFPLGRFAEHILPFWLSDKLTILGCYWLALLYYLFLLLLLFDILRFVSRLSGIGSFSRQPFAYAVILIITLTCGIVGYGWWNANSPILRHYDITIDKSTPGIETLHAVMVSDIHLDKLVDTSRLARLVDAINQLNPDIVFLPGDIIDEDVDLFIAKKMPDILRRLQPPLGVYGVLGNHEYISRKPDLVVQELNNGGVVVLRDRYVTVADSFYVIGRDDRSQERSAGRKTLVEIMAGIDRSLPLFLLDHQPFDLQQAEAAGIDLQLSGHTHHGQFAPNNLITQAIYEVDWGYLRKNALQVIVSCGYGTWGPPIRIGNQPEIVDITIHFTPVGP